MGWVSEHERPAAEFKRERPAAEPRKTSPGKDAHVDNRAAHAQTNRRVSQAMQSNVDNLSRKFQSKGCPAKWYRLSKLHERHCQCVRSSCLSGNQSALTVSQLASTKAPPLPPSLVQRGVVPAGVALAAGAIPPLLRAGAVLLRCLP